MVVEVTTPTRIDLAGGTLDVYPLFLLLEGAVTVNMAVNITCRARVEPSADGRIHLHSLDAGQSASAESLEQIPTDGPLGTIGRAVRFFHAGGGVNITTHSAAPRGSGLGASSSLLVALAVALCRYNNVRMSKEALVYRIAELEAQCIGIPTGKQDYYAALHGGVNAIDFLVGQNRVENLGRDTGFLRALEEHSILTFTGESRQSAIANWNMVKGFVEDLGDNRVRMRAIKQIALEMREALLARDLRAAGELLGKEWECRRGLAEGVSTPQTEAMIAAAKAAGAWASKICGAGGGGCMITLAPPDRREQVLHALGDAGAKEIPFRIWRSRMRVKQS